MVLPMGSWIVIQEGLDGGFVLERDHVASLKWPQPLCEICNKLALLISVKHSNNAR